MRLVAHNMFASLQFLARFHQCPVVVWCDLMKCGRLTGTEVHDFCEVLATIIKRNPGKTAAIVVAPFLISEKVAGYRGELRTDCKILLIPMGQIITFGAVFGVQFKRTTPPRDHKKNIHLQVALQHSLDSVLQAMGGQI